MLRAVMLIVAMKCPVLAVAADQPAGKWHRSYEEGRQAAHARGLPLLLHFYADWCGPCARMESGVLGAADVLRLLDQTVIGVKVNIDHESALAERFDVSSLPADVLVLPAGKVLASWNGCIAAQAYAERLRRAASAGEPPPAAAEVQTVAATQTSPDQHPPEPCLSGYCPVSITRDRAWRKGQPQFTCAYQENVYTLQSGEELQRFRSDPARYAPRLRGFDPVALADHRQRETGSVYHTAMYRGGLYLLSSAENQRRFCQSPGRYVYAAEQSLSALSSNAVTASAGPP